MAEKDKNPNKIDVSRIDLDKMKEKTTETPGLLPYAHTSGGAVIKPDDLGKIKGKSVMAMEQQTDNQMQQLYEQMDVLVQQAKSLKERRIASERIYLANIPFEPLIGHTYYLYQRSETSDVLSMIAPGEWGRSKKFQKYIAKVQLLADHTWDVSDFAEDEFNTEQADG
ncbi:MAG: hypothetical protein ACI85I_000493 [Arenicella sp.]|jgi:hypothetical protein